MGTLVFLIILIVATAVLIAWLLVELARLALGDLRFSKVPEGSLQGAPSGPRSIPAADALSSAVIADPRTPERLASHRAADATEGAGRAGTPDQEADAENVLYDEADVEEAVRDRLYGRRGRRS